jgi:hypothetical protein
VITGAWADAAHKEANNESNAAKPTTFHLNVFISFKGYPADNGFSISDVKHNVYQYLDPLLRRGRCWGAREFRPEMLRYFEQQNGK